MATFTLTDITIKRPAGSGVSDDVFTDGSGSISDHPVAIGELVTFVSRLAVNYNIAGNQLQFVQSYFVPINASLSGTARWFFSIPNVITPGDVIPGAWYGKSVSGQNLSCNIVIGTNDGTNWNFTVEHTMYITGDPKGYIKDQVYVNHDWLLKNSLDNPVELTNTDLNDGYHLTPKGQYIFSIYLLDTIGSAGFVALGKFPKGTMNLIGRFYGVDNSSGVPGAINFQFSVDTFLNPFNDCVLSVQGNFGLAGTTPGTVYAYMIRTDAQNNNVQLDANYGDSPVRLVTAGGTAAVGKYFGNPCTIWQNVGAGIYKSNWKIKAANIIPNAKYRVILISYDTHFSSAISDELNVVVIGQQTDLSVKYDLMDYNAQTSYDLNQDSAKNVITTVQDRLTTRIVKNTDVSFYNYMQALLTQLGTAPQITPRQVTLKIISTPAPGVLHVLQQQVWNFQNWLYDAGLGKFRASFGITGDGTVAHDNDINHSFLSTDGATMDDFAGIWYDIVCRYEPDVQCLYSYVNGKQVPAFGTQNWVGQVQVIWDVQYDYNFTLRGVKVGYSDIQDYTNVINVNDYESTGAKITSIVLQDTEGNALTSLCDIGRVMAKVQLNLAYYDNSTPLKDPTKQNLIPFIDKQTYGIANLLEGDLYTNPVQPIPQLTTTFITGGTPTFDATGVAYFFFNADLLTETDTYRISVLVKPIQGALPVSNNELREDGGKELREDNGLELREQ